LTDGQSVRGAPIAAPAAKVIAKTETEMPKPALLFDMLSLPQIAVIGRLWRKLIIKRATCQIRSGRTRRRLTAYKKGIQGFIEN
jgi:hypothetical protein